MDFNNSTDDGNYTMLTDANDSMTITSEKIVGIDIGDFGRILAEVGKAFCMIMEFFPSKELTFPHRVSEDCVLEFTVKKR